MRSDDVKAGLERAAHRSLLHALGLHQQDIDRPWIGIANSWSDIVPGHKWLRELSEEVRGEVARAGGTPFEFDSICICDGLCQGHQGMKYSLPSREIICDSVEAMAESHRLDGLVFISSCDKIVPGHLMAAARVNVPSIVVTGGPMLPGKHDEKVLTLVDMREFIGRVQAGTLTEEELREIEGEACPGPGSCAMMGTANTMSVAAEALGMSLPGTATAHAGTETKKELGRRAGNQIMELLRRNLRPRQIMTRAAFENAMRVVVALGGSLNAVLHLIAIAGEAGSTIEFADFDRVSSSTPQICSVRPSGEHTMLDLDGSGGVQGAMSILLPLLDSEAQTVAGSTIGELVRGARPRSEEVLRSLERPYRPEGGIAVLRGNLAPLGSLIKTSALSRELMTGRAPAKVFDELETAIEWIRDREMQEETCIVIRYEGPKGGPGMREMHMITSLIVGRGLAGRVFLVTDGRFSGSTRGPFIGYVCPEAHEGGPIALVKDGDYISYSVDARSIELEIGEIEMAERRRKWKRTERSALGVLARYREMVLGSNKGAALKSP
jgi:dihydroxy-acid dehydratase